MEIRADETWDDLQNGYGILQAKKGFRFGIDAVLLADFAAIAPEDSVLDLGCGSGILPLLLCARKKGTHITGLEIRPESAGLARRSAAANGLEEKITIIEGDLREADSLFEAASFDAVVSNPPYMLPSQGKVSPNEQIAAARHEIFCTFADVAAAARHVLKDGSRFFLVHRAAREQEILQTLAAHGLPPARLRRVQPFADRAANLILVEASRLADSAEAAGTAPGALKVERPLIVYKNPGVYTQEVLEIYNQEALCQES